jgi:hypothetical protein
MFVNEKKRSFGIGGLGNASSSASTAAGAGGPGGANGPGGQAVPIEDASDQGQQVDPQSDPALRQLELRQLANRFEDQNNQAPTRVQGQSRGLLDPSLGGGSVHTQIDENGGGVTTYGWKMFEEEEEKRDKIMREQDVLDLLQRLREEAVHDERGVATFLRAHPQLVSAMSEVMIGAGANNGVDPASGGSGNFGGGFA